MRLTVSSYVAALELRIEKLERRLTYARSRKASVALHEQDGPPAAEHPQDRKDSLANIRAAIHRKAERKRENSDVNALVSDFGYMSINATTRDFEPTLSNMTFARLMLAAVTNDPLSDPQTPGLPAKQTAHAIVHYYMINIYPLFPLFQETVLLSALDDMYQQDRNVSSTNKWLVFMVLAIGSMAQSRSNHDECYKNGVEFVSHALQFADRALQLGSVSQIQSLALFTQYSTLDPAHFDSWQLIGATCRAVVDLGFHQDPVTQGQTDRVALDKRRKTFYCVYALDRAISMVHARAFSFSDDSINVDLPAMSGIGRIASVAGTITGPQSHDPAILLFQLRRIQSHWYQTLIQSDPNQPIEGADGDTASFIWQVCQDMREWDESLPETLPIGIRELFNLELKYSYVYCLAPSARAPVMTAYGRVLIFEYAIAYLDHVYGIATHGSADPNPSFYTYHDALRVFFMGSQFMAVLRDAGDAILAGASVPVPLSLPGKAPPPPLPTRTSNEDNLTRSIRCLERVKVTLQKYGERWLDAQSLLQSFDTLSEGLIKDLKAKQQQAMGARASIGTSKDPVISELAPSSCIMRRFLVSEEEQVDILGMTEGYSARKHIASLLREAAIPAVHLDIHETDRDASDLPGAEALEMADPYAVWRVKSEYFCMGLDPGCVGLELSSRKLPANKLGFAELDQVLRLTRNNVLVRLTQDCGLHVHIDASALDLNEQRQFVCLYLITENVLFSLCHPSRRVSEWCCQVYDSSRLASKANDLIKKGGHVSDCGEWPLAKDVPARMHLMHRAIHDLDSEELRNGLMQSYVPDTRNALAMKIVGQGEYTFEFRHFQGSFDSALIQNWTRVCLGLVMAAKGLGHYRQPPASQLYDVFYRVSCRPEEEAWKCLLRVLDLGDIIPFWERMRSSYASSQDGGLDAHSELDPGAWGRVSQYLPRVD
ncbi:hypothetical protein VPNG_01445 [Cytospora leucostoma]|uniref:Xylanolytic transcriptional activator regulatory domain-containing protein n=1 Tax=Cytospora leucostoma TaxID=1230097 RepID=A0A423XJT9_9PEZI|nr:hypothetical protein VPNG_01445 [Cytospora leucostoma]